MQMRTVELSRFKKTSSNFHGGSQGFEIVFIYMQNGDSFVLKGMEEEVCNYLQELAIRGSFLYCRTHYCHGRLHGKKTWRFGGPSAYGRKVSYRRDYPAGHNWDDEFKPGYKPPRMRFFITITKPDPDSPTGKTSHRFSLRRMPKKWIPEFN